MFSRFYITASSSNRHRILKIDRTASDSLNVFEDHAVYNAKQLDTVLRMVDDGNKSAGGLEKVLDSSKRIRGVKPFLLTRSQRDHRFRSFHRELEYHSLHEAFSGGTFGRPL